MNGLRNKKYLILRKKIYNSLPPCMYFRFRKKDHTTSNIRTRWKHAGTQKDIKILYYIEYIILYKSSSTPSF